MDLNVFNQTGPWLRADDNGRIALLGIELVVLWTQQRRVPLGENAALTAQHHRLDQSQPNLQTLTTRENRPPPAGWQE